MSDLFRDAPIGQIIRLVTKNRYLKYPEEEPDWQCPSSAYLQESEKRSLPISSSSSTLADGEQVGKEDLTTIPTSASSEIERDAYRHALQTTQTQADVEAGNVQRGSDRTISQIMSRPEMNKVNTLTAVDDAYSNAIRQESIKQQPSRPIQPSRTADGRTLVDWYSTDDQANPQNWSQRKKLFVVSQIFAYTLAVYMGSAIFTPSAPYVMEKFGVSQTVASLGLSMYVLGYGIGPLIFSPMSEIPIVGRNPPYMVTFAIFVIISIPTAFVENFAALIVLRFLQGFFGSPILATGGASIGDLFNLMELPYFLTGWASAATCGPALGPIISGFSVPAKDWHWSLYEIIWLSAPVFLFLLFFLPETSAENILLRRACRLRKLTGKTNLVAQSEINQAELSVREVVVGSLWRPMQINALDPAVLFTSLYIALVYAIFYSFFECFPLVYGTGIPRSVTRGYGMNAGEQGLIFLSVTVGVLIAIPIYIWYLKFVFEPEVRRSGIGAPERRLVPGLYASLIAPVGLFIFAWTGFNSPSIHWIVPTIGIVLFMAPVFIMFQVIFIYIPMTYPQYAASLFAGNDFFRSALAAGAIHFAQPLFHNLGIGRAVSLLGGLTVMGVIGIYGLYFYGARLRANSRFAAK